MAAAARNVEALLEHADYVRSLAKQLVFDEELARDVEQQTWLAALEHAPRDPRSPRAWLAQIVRNFAFRAWRGEARRTQRERAVSRPENAVTTPADILEREGVRRALIEAVLALDEPYRTALILRYFDELEPREVAHRLGVPFETVRTRIKRGHELLRARLQREHGRGHGVWALALVKAMRLEPSSYGAVASAAAKTLLQGVLVMSVVHKVVLGVAAVAVLAASLVVWNRSDAASPADTVVAPSRAGELALEPSDETRAERTASGERAEVSAAKTVETPAAPADTRFGSLLLHFVWADDKTPATGINAKVYQSASEDYYQDVLLVRSDASGSVLIDPILAGRQSLYFDRGGRGGAQVERGQRTEQTIEIPLGFDLEGRVLDAQGSGVAGADVYVYQCMGDSFEGDVLARSGEDGSYSIRSLGAGGLSFVSARAAGRGPTNQKLVTSVAGAKVHCDIVFEAAGGAIEGRVLAPDGVPCEHATVVVGDGGDSQDRVSFDDGSEGRVPALQRTFTDTQGRFRVDGVAEGTLVVQARAKGFAPWKGEVEISAGRTTARDISLVHGAKLSGSVRDESGNPVARAQVSVGRYGFDGSFRKSKDDGAFEFDCVPLGEFEVSVETDDKGLAKTTLFGESGAALRWDAELSRGLVLRGRVEAPGRDVEKWWFNIQSNGGGGEFFMQSATSDKTGRFEVIGCPDVPLRIEAHAPGTSFWPTAILEDVRASAGEVVVRPDPTLEPTVHIRGRVLDSDGHPLAGVQVIPSREGMHNSPILASAVDTGKFELGPYPSGDWHLRFKQAGFADVTVERRDVRAGEAWDLGDVVLQRGGTVVAHFLRSEGVAENPGYLRMSSSDRTSEWLFVDGDTARSGPVMPGRYTVWIHGDGIALESQEVDVRAGEETSIEIPLHTGVPVTVRFADPSDRPFDGELQVEIRAAGGVAHEFTFGPHDGAKQWTGHLLPGSYHVTARDDLGHHGELDVSVAAAPLEQILTVR
jgi:RNA polymerase sigma-70 factor (ECF subfamily)